MTFAELDRIAGCPEPEPDPQYDDFPLPTWYREVRNTPIDELTLYDVCLACGQQIHLTHMLPVAIRILEQNPIAGEYYDGHLLSSLEKTPIDYWVAHRDQAVQIHKFLTIALSLLPADHVALENFSKLNSMLASVLEG